jgi:GT2 family glycosyltransferase
VVIPAVNGHNHLKAVLAALDRERASMELETLVVSRLGPELRKRVLAESPWVQVLDVDPGTPIPQMRAAAFGAAHAPLVAVLEDHVIVPQGWAQRVVAAARETGGVVGGPLENAATRTLVDRAAFLCEYSHCLPPGPKGESDWLPGNNVAYPADVLHQHAGIAEAGGWENEMHAAIRRSGGQLIFVPEMVAYHDMSYSLGGYIAQRYLYARSFAGNRLRGASFALRAAYAGATLALPPLLLLRISRNVLGNSRYRNSFLMSLPLLVLFVVAWAVGEIVGYLAGPGDALAKVR